MRIISLFILCALSSKYIQLQSRSRWLLLCDDYRCRRIKSLKRILFVILLNILTAVNERCPDIDFRVEKFIMMICLIPYNLWILTEQLMIRNLFASFLFDWLRNIEGTSPEIFDLLMINCFFMDCFCFYIHQMFFDVFKKLFWIIQWNLAVRSYDISLNCNFIRQTTLYFSILFRWRGL